MLYRKLNTSLLLLCACMPAVWVFKGGLLGTVAVLVFTILLLRHFKLLFDDTQSGWGHARVFFSELMRRRTK